MSSGETVRVRFAPSPTGRLHIGGARTALFNWAFARHCGGAFVLRIEDTDRERNTDEALRSIAASLRWLGLDWDEGPEVGGAAGPYFQSERGGFYAAAAEQLLEEGRAYRCFCTPERVQALKEEQRAAKENPRYDGRCREIPEEEARRRAAEGEPCTLRFAVEPAQEVVVNDLVRGEVSFRSEEVEDWVMLRTGGHPTYNFSCVVDDASMRISHVLRGEEHLVNTPKQVLLYRALGLEAPAFAHVPLILGQDGKKLSKRTGDTALEDYREKGCPPEALFNFLSLLGFSIDDHTEVFTPDEMVAAFDWRRVGRAGAIFDPAKLHWLCGEYLRRTPVPELTDRVLPWLEAAGLAPRVPAGEERAWLERLVAAFRERIRLYSELPEQAGFLFSGEVQADTRARKALEAEGAGALLEAAAASLEAEEAFPPSDFDAWALALAEGAGAGLGRLLKPMRAALAGTLGGPPVGEILGLLGRERSLARLRAPIATRG